jgi:drug/metabolite transporter (DMT)-like permease
MTMTTSFALILAVGMLITGSINTISTKLADNQNVTGLDPTTPHTFNHPFFQAVLMFLGESLCLLTFWSKRYLCSKKKDDTAASSSNEALLSNNRNRTRSSSSLNSASPSSSTKSNWSPLIFLLPACCDMTGTSLMYVGLNLTHASVFQMLRGSVILFTGIFSVFFLGRKLYAFHWIGMSLVLTGTMIVGVASVLYPDGNTSSASNPLLGDIIIILAQIVAAVQMVVEEKLIGGHGIPALQAVGWEGVWGFTVLSVVLIGMYYAPGVTGFTPTLSHFENTPDALVQISRSGPLAAACMGNILSIAFFNFFGLSVTKYMSATHRYVVC